MAHRSYGGLSNFFALFGDAYILRLLALDMTLNPFDTVLFIQ